METISDGVRQFILHWGEMGARWGINRTMAQIHALLYVTARPLPAEDIAEALGVARSNVSTSLRELQNWRIVRLVHLAGDKRDHFESLRDVWEMCRIILDERMAREIEPTRELLQRCLTAAGASAGGPLEPEARRRLAELAEFFEVSQGWYNQVSRLPPPVVLRFLKLGTKAFKLLRLMP